MNYVLFFVLGLMLLPWIFSFLNLYETKGISIWLKNLFIFIVLTVLFYGYLAVYGPGPSRFGIDNSVKAILAAMVIAPFWGLILWRYSHKRKKRMSVKPSPFDDILDAD